MDFDPRTLQRRIDDRLAHHLGGSLHDGGEVLVEAASAAALGRGKRMRPILAMLACKHGGKAPERALDFGCAVEFVHAASLVLDDLPCMDDARERRGAVSIHRRYGEDTAILAAVAMIAQAQRIVLAPSETDPQVRSMVADCLARAVGFDGLARGQIRDLRPSEFDRTESGLRNLNYLKTGVLFEVSALGGAIMAGATENEGAELAAFGREIGFAFQLADDLADLGEDGSGSVVDGRSVTEGNFNFVTLWGVDRVRNEIAASLSRARIYVDDRSDLHSYAVSQFKGTGIRIDAAGFL